VKQIPSEINVYKESAYPWAIVHLKVINNSPNTYFSVQISSNASREDIYYSAGKSTEGSLDTVI